MMNKPKLPAAVIVLTGACLQLIGAICLARIPTHTQLYRPQYGFQVLIGAGVGFSAAGLILLVPYIVQKRDLAVGTASISQFRVLGCLVALAIATSVSAPYIRNHLDHTLPLELASIIIHRARVSEDDIWRKLQFANQACGRTRSRPNTGNGGDVDWTGCDSTELRDQELQQGAFHLASGSQQI
ncbi:hypothetical protein CC86DRAFT_419528 [Ophiobolus disseminans]|uniref:Major facilitator superfamily (MFS) profile domain-containing protein n=1 Tax=Ophiobolus disseminans TaxID=1469910 RepID=A0A6A6ZY77_9PLEO|nr:hypothetical protein CC86DRAFT_419528 [Ophiobolus disseminans]